MEDNKDKGEMILYQTVDGESEIDTLNRVAFILLCAFVHL